MMRLFLSSETYLRCEYGVDKFQIRSVHPKVMILEKTLDCLKQEGEFGSPSCFFLRFNPHSLMVLHSQRLESLVGSVCEVYSLVDESR